MASERTEQPTPKRRQDARRRGQVAVSREVDSAVALLAAFLAFRASGPGLWKGLQSLLRDTFRAAGHDPLNVPLTAALGQDVAWRALSMLLPLMGLILAFGLVSGVAQTGGVLSMEPLKPQLKRLNPLSGAKRVFMSRQGLVSLLRALIKFAVLGLVGWMTLRGRWAELMALGIGMPLGASLSVISSVAFSLIERVLIAMVALAAADFVFQRRELGGQLRMSRQEVKEELRQSEGDPQVKAAMARQRRAFVARVMQALPQADVVLANPTHFAVALKYDPATQSAPVVIAKGQDLLALRMRERATELGIPVIENPTLTRAIHRAIPVGREITPDLYEAVAEVLAFVYRLRYPRARITAA